MTSYFIMHFRHAVIEDGTETMFTIILAALEIKKKKKKRF